ncbi:MAG: substrate-binding domain-containing protein [Salaquimonas sp.]|jgi:LacI family transcriptional regulator|nr:substrate-binding domain-containing protein [Salaquimonas sp.]
MKLKELADALSLSPTTVSRALNGYPEVSEATRKRVIEAARASAYQPSSSAKGLATGKSMSIGHVVPLGHHMMIDPHFADFIAGAGETYAREGYDMLISVVPEAEQERAYRALAASRKVDGMIVHGPKQNDPRIALLHDLGVPFIVHGRTSDPDEDYSWLDINNRRCFRRATEFLMDLGHRRIALLNGLDEMSFAMRRRTGFEEAHGARDMTVAPELMFHDEMTEPNGYARARQVLGSDMPPSAIMTSSVLQAIGTVRALRDAGLEPGKDVSVLTHDDRLSFLQEMASVPIFTATRSSIRDAGRRCAELIIGLADDPEGGPVHELWEAELVVGASTGRAREVV